MMLQPRESDMRGVPPSHASTSRHQGRCQQKNDCVRGAGVTEAAQALDEIRVLKNIAMRSLLFCMLHAMQRCTRSIGAGNSPTCRPDAQVSRMGLPAVATACAGARAVSQAKSAADGQDIKGVQRRDSFRSLGALSKGRLRRRRAARANTRSAAQAALGATCSRAAW